MSGRPIRWVINVPKPAYSSATQNRKPGRTMLVPGSVNDLDRPHSTMAKETRDETVEIRRIEKS
jgi:hypothetical protein